MHIKQLNELLKHERSIQNNWIPGELLFKDSNKYLFIQTFNKQSGYFLLVRDFYNNQLSYYDYDKNDLYYQFNLILWNQIIGSKERLSFIRSNKQYINSYYLSLFLLKKQIRRFFRLLAKPNVYRMWKKNTKPISVGFNTNIKLYYIKSLLNVILKKNINERKYKYLNKVQFLFFYLKFLKLYNHTYSSLFIFFKYKHFKQHDFVKYKERKKVK